MTTPLYRCWKDGASEDLALVLSCHDSEHAAQEFADRWIRYDPDRLCHIDGDPIVVNVRDDVDGELTRWEVQATSTIDFAARQIGGGDQEAPSASAPRRCAKCGLAENEHDVRHVFVAARGA